MKPIFSDLDSFPLQFYVVAFVECNIFQEKKGEVVVTVVERVIMVGVCASRRITKNRITSSVAKCIYTLPIGSLSAVKFYLQPTPI